MNKRGYWAAGMAVFLPVLLLVMGFALDGGALFLRTTQLSNAVKYAAISASSIYELDEYENYHLTASFSQVETLLKLNLPDAELAGCSIDESRPGTCTVKGSCEAEFVFMKIFGIETKTVTAEFTASRSAG